MPVSATEINEFIDFSHTIEQSQRKTVSEQVLAFKNAKTTLKVTLYILKVALMLGI